MGIAVVGVAFEYSLDNGGREIKIAFQRDESSKVRQINLVGKNDVIIKIKET